ncbi:MAG: FG-GAP repeat domain-containing protein [Desulfuromonadaceae bacterium]
MKSMISVLTALILFMTISGTGHANPIKTHVAPFNVTGGTNNHELKISLQEILTSRLNPDQVLLVEKPEQAEYLIAGSYAQFGKLFSLDILIKNNANGSLVKVFEQGEGQEDVIPAIGRLAKKIDAEMAKRSTPAAPVASAPVRTAPMPIPVAPAASLLLIKEQYIVKSEPSSLDAPGSWSSAPIEGVFNSIAPGRTLPSGERELFVSGEQMIRAYLKGKELTLVTEITLPLPAKILALDSADLDKDGTPELYVTIIEREAPASRVYQFNGTSFVAIAEKLPWFFRAIGTDIYSRRVYAQEIDNDGKYYGGVKELTKSDSRFTAKEAQILPDSANIFNFNRLNGAGTKGHIVVLDEDGYLVVYPPDGAEAWKSSEKYGGSESFFKNEAKYHRSTGDLLRWMFLEQRMTPLKDGTLLVPRNEGTFSFGNNRSFDKYSLFSLEETGAVLKEKWHTRPSPGYLADYSVDQNTGEILLLEVVKKPGMFTKGKTVISIRKID